MKKGFVFSFDSFLALTIFVLFIILIYFFFISSTPATQQYYFSEDMLNVMSNVKINELNLNKYPQIDILVQDNKINPSSTIMEELITLKLKDDTESACSLFDGALKGLKLNLQAGFDLGKEKICNEKTDIKTNLVSRSRLGIGRI